MQFEACVLFYFGPIATSRTSKRSDVVALENASQSQHLIGITLPSGTKLASAHSAPVRMETVDKRVSDLNLDKQVLHSYLHSLDVAWLPHL